MTLHKGIDVSNYQSSLDYNLLQEKGYDTIIINCGGADSNISSDPPNIDLDSHYINARENGFKTGFYFFVYWNTDPKAQAQEFLNNIEGKISDTRFFLDIEKKSEKYGKNYCENLDVLAQEIIQEMQLLASQQGLILDDSAFAIYSPGNFAILEPISVKKYGLWLADTNTDSQPTETSIPWAMVTENGINKTVTFDDWIGLQWNIYGEDSSTIKGSLGSSNLDVDVFKETCYLTTPVTIGTTKGIISSKTLNSNLKVGDYVKIVSSENFAPNLIPSTNKGVKYTIDSINGSMCKLSEINEWVDFEDLSLIQSPNPPSEPIGSLAHPLGSNANAEQIFNICKGAGWSVEAICGMLGNLSCESYLNPTQGQQGGGGGYGLAQWSYSDLVEYAEETGVSDYNTIPGQMEIIIEQMSTPSGGGQYIPRSTTPPGYWLPPTEFTNSAQSPSYLAQAWMYSYEDPSILHKQKRIEGAEYWYAYFTQK